VVWLVGREGGAFEQEEEDFLFSKTSQFPSKSAKSGVDTLLMTPFIPNIYGVIMVFKEFFWSDPLPTPEK